MARWGNGQFYMAPRVDHISDRGVGYWVRLGEAHGFGGPHIQLGGMPVRNQGLKSLVAESPFSWLWVWPDANWVPDGSIGIPAGGLMGDVAKRYYDEMAAALPPIHSYGMSVGSDVLEWVGGGDLHQAQDDIEEWAEWMTGLLGFTTGGLLIGARSSTGVKWPGTYAGWGHHFDNKALVSADIRMLGIKSGGLPNFAGEDRLRERDPLRRKDLTQPQQLRAMPAFLEEGAGAIWGVLGLESDGRHETGTLPWTDPAAVREILLGTDPSPPPNGDTCDQVADRIASDREVFEETITEALAAHFNNLTDIETAVRTCCKDGEPGPGPGPGPDPDDNDLEGITVIGVVPGWHIPGYPTTCKINTVELDDTLHARWDDQGWPEADIGPFPPTNPHHLRLYLVNFRTSRMWGVEWGHRPVEATRTTVYPWDGEGLDIVDTLTAKAKGDSDLADIRDGDRLGVVIAAPHLRERSSVLEFTA